MSFNSIIFIFLFLPITLFAYYMSKDKYKNYVLLFFSIIFFIWTGLDVFSSIVIITALNYLLSYAMNKSKYKKTFLILSLFLSIGTLIYYKYTNFLLDILNISESSSLKILVPLGISYITFQQISYSYDIYKKKISFDKNIANYFLYILFFPKIVAGPITKYTCFANQLKERSFSKQLFNEGIQKFSIGLGKKVIIASTLQTFVDEVFAIDPNNIRTPILYIALLSYTLQIYFDFSGYTDMALGVAKMFSFELPENFNRPYIAKSITDFWKRWHISLTSFLREYLYFPLGGNRKGRIRTLINIFIIFFVSGLWHGASFTFIIWGIYFGVLMIIEKLGLSKLLAKVPSFISLSYTFILVNIAWVFFRSDTLEYSIKFLKRLISIGGYEFVSISSFTLTNKFFIIFIIALIIVFFPVRIIRYLKISISMQTLITRVSSILILIYSLAIIASGSFKPFIYFNF